MLSVSVLRGLGDAPPYFIAQTEDITERKRARRRPSEIVNSASTSLSSRRRWGRGIWICSPIRPFGRSGTIQIFGHRVGPFRHGEWPCSWTT